jgi:hypothetical protein
VKLETVDALGELAEIGRNLTDRLAVVLFLGELQELAGIRQAASQCIEGGNDFFERRPFLAERLRALRLVPDVRLLELALDFLQPLRLGVVVKDTPSTQRCVQRDRQAYGESGSFP